MTESGYRARIAQDAVEANLARPKSRRLDDNPALFAEVLRRLKQRHSPEQIAGRLPEDFPDDPEMWVSHETIYQGLFVQARGVLARLVKTACGQADATHTTRAAKDTAVGHRRT